MEGIKRKQLTETRVEVMFREIVVGQELVNKDLLESMRERLEEKLAQIQEEVNDLAQDQRQMQNQQQNPKERVSNVSIPKAS